jgi:hypothetical protein
MKEGQLFEDESGLSFLAEDKIYEKLNSIPLNRTYKILGRNEADFREEEIISSMVEKIYVRNHKYFSCIFFYKNISKKTIKEIDKYLASRFVVKLFKTKKKK